MIDMYPFVRYCIIFYCFIILAVACNNVNRNDIATFKVIDFTNDSGWETAYSCKIDSIGNLIFAMGRWNKTFYVGKLSKRQLSTIDSFYSATPFNTFDSVYTDTPTDLSTVQIVILNNNKSKRFYIYGDKEPKELRVFIDYLRSIESNVMLAKKDSTIEFESRKGLYQVPPPSHAKKQ